MRIIAEASVIFWRSIIPVSTAALKVAPRYFILVCLVTRVPSGNLTGDPTSFVARSWHFLC